MNSKVIRDDFGGAALPAHGNHSVVSTRNDDVEKHSKLSFLLAGLDKSTLIDITTTSDQYKCYVDSKTGIVYIYWLQILS